MPQTLITPAQIRFAAVAADLTVSATVYTINKNQQLNAATLSINQTKAEHFTQERGPSVDISHLGAESTLTVSLADFDFDAMAQVFGSTVVTDGTTGNKRFAITDNTGKRFTKYQVVVTPYDGDVPTTDLDMTFTLPYAALSVESELSFGKEDQTEYTAMFTAFPHPTSGFVVVRGDLLATPAPPPP